MRERRIVQNGNPLNYTCHNAKFETNLAKGEPQAVSSKRGFQPTKAAACG